MMYSFSASTSRTNSNIEDLEQALLPDKEVEVSTTNYYTLFMICIFVIFIIGLMMVIIYHIM